MKFIVPSIIINTLLLAITASTSHNPTSYDLLAHDGPLIVVKLYTFQGAKDPTATVFVPLDRIQPTEITVDDPVYGAIITRRAGYNNGDVICQLYEDVEDLEGLKAAGSSFHGDETLSLDGTMVKWVRCETCGDYCSH